MVYVDKSIVAKFLGVDESLIDDALFNVIESQAEAKVDRLTGTCWNGKVCTTEGYEYHSITRYLGTWLRIIGVPIHLAHRPVKEIISLQVWSGSVWDEWVGNKREGREGDYWVDYEEGIIYLRPFLFYFGGKEVKVKYSYGHDELPADVQKLTMFYVIKDLLMMDRKLYITIDTGSSLSIKDMMDYIDKEIEVLEGRLRAIKIITGTLQ